MLKNMFEQLKFNNTEVYSFLYKYLEYEFIPKHMTMVNIKNDETKEIDTYPSIDLRYIISLNNPKKVLMYLAKVKVLVNGLDPMFYCHNYHYVENLIDNNQELELIEDNDNDLMNQYYDTRDIKLRDIIILKNIGLVKYLAYRIATITNVEMQDLESYGYEGMIKAIRNFDPNICTDFLAFLYQCIKNEMKNGLANIYGLKRNKFFEDFCDAKFIVETETKEELQNNFELVYYILDTLLKEGSISKRNIVKNRDRVSLLIPESIDSLSENIVDSDDCFELELEKDIFVDGIREIIDKLPVNQQLVLEEFYGFNGMRYSDEEIANMYGAKVERIRCIKSSAINRLRNKKMIIQLKRIKNDNKINYVSTKVTFGKKY